MSVPPSPSDMRNPYEHFATMRRERLVLVECTNILATEGKK